MSRSQIVMIVSGFPRRSETFALNEVLALEAHGMLAAIFATKPGDGAYPQPGSEELLRRVQILKPGNPEEQAEMVVEHLDGQIITGVHGYFAHTPAVMSPGGTNIPVRPSLIASRIPPMSLATTGRPQAIASSTTFGNPSRSPL